jgi:hypothetical protein
MRGLGAVAFLLLAAVLSSVAKAEPIPAKNLAADRRACTATCTSRGLPLAKCTPYCDCFTNGIGAEFTFEEYTATAEAAKQNQYPSKDVMDRTAAISKACAASVQ